LIAVRILLLLLCAESVHKWNKDASDWGFTQFMPFADAVNPEKGYLLNDTLKIKVEIQVQVRTGRQQLHGLSGAPTAVASGSLCAACSWQEVQVK
jgi:hypothetical protein